jgi:MFS family permease
MIAVARRGVRTPKGIIRVYLTSSGLFTLATSLIWGVNTLFLLDAGLDIFQVMIVNAAFSAGQVVFEVPTGVIADTIGRRTSFLLGIATLFLSTLIYVAAWNYGWNIWGFIGASLILGLGYTFQTGAVDAWLVDALDYAGFDGHTEDVFARAGMVFGIAMLLGTLAGGFLGQVSLGLPFVIRAGILVVAFVVVFFTMYDMGFQHRPLKASRFGAETRTIFEAGVTYGWKHRVVRPLLLISFVWGLFMMYFFYSSQPYALEILGQDLIWVAGALTALYGLMGVVGNLLVSRIMKLSDGGRRSSASVLAVCSGLASLIVLAMAIVGFTVPEGGSVWWFAALVVLTAGFGILFGLMGPVRQAFLNRQIPSAQRATVLSLDSFFDEVGGLAGQPAFGYLARVTSIPVSYTVGAVVMGLAYPLYRRAEKAVAEQESAVGDEHPDESGGDTATMHEEAE